MKKRYLLLIFSFIFGVSLFGWVIKTVGWGSIEQIFSAISFKQVLIIFLLSLLIPFLEGYRWREVLKIQDKEIPLKDAVRLSISSFAINFLAPALIAVAEIFRGYFLKQKKDYSGSKITSSIIIDRIIGWTVDVVFVVGGIVCFLNNAQTISHDFLVKIGWVFLFLFSLLFFFYFRALRRKSIFSVFYYVLSDKIQSISEKVEKEIFVFFEFSREKLLIPFVISLLKDLVMCLRTWLLVSFLDGNILVSSAFAILAFTFLAIIIPVPASLGAYEALQVFAFESLGLTSSLAVAFTMIIRGASFMVTFVGMFFLLQIGGSFLRSYFIENEEE